MNQSPKKIKITLEDVLKVSEKGFERMDKQFKELEIRLSEKIDKLDTKITTRVEKLEDSNRVIKTKLAI
jgi:hypothetical protein